MRCLLGVLGFRVCLLTSILANAFKKSSTLISFSLAGTTAAILPVATCRPANLKSFSLILGNHLTKINKELLGVLGL